jgi:uncharacterized protein YecE (DUF72 family)
VGGKILIGTASWSDPGFVERWYPKKMPASERLGWYAEHFELVEVNSTFYSVPEPRMVERWCAATPDDFTFDVKLHQLFSFHSTPAKLRRRICKGAQKSTGRQGEFDTDLREAHSKIFCAQYRSLDAENLAFYFCNFPRRFSAEASINRARAVDRNAEQQILQLNLKLQLGNRRSIGIDNRCAERCDFVNGAPCIGSFHCDAVECGRGDEPEGRIPAAAWA